MKVKTINSKRFIVSIVLIVFFVYLIFTLIMQQRTINKYKSVKVKNDKKIAELSSEYESIEASKNDELDKDNIEQEARDKLGLIKKNEKFFFDVAASN